MSLTLLPLPSEEDVISRARGDYPLIVPKDQRYAEGSDGAFAAGNRWVLTSAGSDFLALSVPVGAAVVLGSGQAGNTDWAAYRNDLLIASAVTTGAMTLRRRGQTASGVGAPPGSAAGNTSVYFRVLYTTPQLTDAQYEIQRRYNIDTTDDIQDPDELKWAVVFRALVVLYSDAAREGLATSDVFLKKASLYQAELDRQFSVLDNLYGIQRLSGSVRSDVMGDSTPAPIFPYIPPQDTPFWWLY